MSEYEDFEYEDDSDQTETNPAQNWRRKIEKENRDLRKQVAEAQAAQKELAFVKAGIDLNSPMSKYFIKGYEGELTPEAIKQAAEEAQLIAPQKQVDDSEKAGWQESSKIAAGSESAPPPAPWIDRINKAQSADEVFAIFAEAQAQGIDLSPEN